MPSYRSVVEPVLGTRLTLRIDAPGADLARLVEAVVLAEADRLEDILSLFRPGSALTRWRQGELADPPPEVVEVLALAATWHARTGGAFNPCLRALMARWRRAEAEQVLPGAAELVALAAGARLPYAVEDGRLVRTGDCRVVDVHGVAKGWVIDRLVDAALGVDALAGIVVDVGGDVRHAARDAASVAMIAVEDPFAVADNAAPLALLRVADRGVATSGGGRRGWRIDGRWYGHVLDPATGWPLPPERSATAVAMTAADADAAASVASVVGAPYLDELGVAALVVEPGGRVERNVAWTATVDERQ